ncbi:MAG: hypothetical protein N3C12_09015 [Candidatus Binatia bacterium]|nr:hypothetical protein [Candidatus Binatia bacterium]
MDDFGPAAPLEQAKREYLTVVRSDVIDAAGHWFGNLFQRLRALEQSLDLAESPLAGALRSTTDDLDRLAQLLLDYIGESGTQLDCIRAADVMHNFVQLLAQEFQVRVGPEEPDQSQQELLVDVRALTKVRSYFPALVVECGTSAGAAVMVQLAGQSGVNSLSIEVRTEVVCRRLTAAGELYCAVIDKLVSSFGGEFEFVDGEGKAATWVFRFPVRRGRGGANR